MLERPYAALNKALNVYDSCKTTQQQAVAERFADRVQSLFRGRADYDFAHYALYSASKRAYTRIGYGERT